VIDRTGPRGAVWPSPGPSTATITDPRDDTPAITIEEAYKVLKVAPGTAWESVEQSRRQLILQSHPERIALLSGAKREEVLADARRVNLAYATLSKGRSNGR
jgi:preprotein translocase subunit Sec63